jgi:hypothetical protein
MNGFALILARGFVPYAFGRADNLAFLDAAPFGFPVRLLPADTPDALRFHALLNRLNALAFGGMAMPKWVQLDCGVLPSAFVGFAAYGRDLPVDVQAALEAEDDELVPVSEALSLPSLVPGEFVSVSLATLVPGLGHATKRLDLACKRAKSAIGVTQRGSKAEATHRRFGDLEVVAEPVFHDKPETTFVYRLRLA